MLTMHVPVVYTRLLRGGGAGHDDLAKFLALPRDRQEALLGDALTSVPDAPGSYWPADTPDEILARLSFQDKIGRLPYLDSFFVKLDQALTPLLKKTFVSVLKSARGIEQALVFDDLDTAEAVSFLLNHPVDRLYELIDALGMPGSRWVTMVGSRPVVDLRDGKYRVDTTDRNLNENDYPTVERALRYYFPERTIAGLLNMDFNMSFFADDSVTTISFESEANASAAAALIKGASVERDYVTVQRKELTKWGDHKALAALLPYQLIVITRSYKVEYDNMKTLVIWSANDRCTFTGADAESIISHSFGSYNASHLYPVTSTSGVYVLGRDDFLDMTYNHHFSKKVLEIRETLTDAPDAVLLYRAIEHYDLLSGRILLVGEEDDFHQQVDHKLVAFAAVEDSGTLVRKRSAHPLLRIPYNIIVLGKGTVPDLHQLIAPSTILAVPGEHPTTLSINDLVYSPQAYVVLEGGATWTLMTNNNAGQYFVWTTGVYFPTQTPLLNPAHTTHFSNIVSFLASFLTRFDEGTHAINNEKIEQATALAAFDVHVDGLYQVPKPTSVSVSEETFVRLSKKENAFLIVPRKELIRDTSTLRFLGARQLPAREDRYHVVYCVIDKEKDMRDGWIPLNTITVKDSERLHVMIAEMIASAKQSALVLAGRSAFYITPTDNDYQSVSEGLQDNFGLNLRKITIEQAAASDGSSLILVIADPEWFNTQAAQLLQPLVEKKLHIVELIVVSSSLSYYHLTNTSTPSFYVSPDGQVKQRAHFVAWLSEALPDNRL